MKPMKYGDHRERGGGLGMMLAAALVAVAGFSAGTSAQTLTTLYAFTGGADGLGPGFGSLIADASGALYRTTGGGGASSLGTVFRLTPNGDGTYTETVLYSFGGSDGAHPFAGLLADTSGALYGTTNSGGTLSCLAFVGSSNPGCGTVFRLTPNPDGTYSETVLYSFSGLSLSDGAGPYAGLIADASGALYGAALLGGTGVCFNNNPFNVGCGTVFKLTPSATAPWPETVLYNFSGVDGDEPVGNLLADASGALYGTTEAGGASNNGTVFRLTPSAMAPWSETVLYSFSGGSDGAVPFSYLIADNSGALYGTTVIGGANGDGTVFRLTPSATAPETVLHSFSGGDGVRPIDGLIADAAGALYGTTEFGGAGNCSNPVANGCGTVFKLTPNGGGTYTETVLWSFSGSDGKWPTAGLIADGSGALYGTTNSGGGSNAGTVFKLNGSGFVPPGFITGMPGTADCHGDIISFLARTYGGTAHAAAALGFGSVSDLQNAVTAFCGG